MSRSLVLVRHGESTWNQENRFSGWRDVPLNDRGSEQAHSAGRILRDDGFEFDVAFTSYLKRAIKTLWIILEELDQMWIPEHKHWRLNERHYGKLQGLNKAEMAREYGEGQVHLWRRSWDVPPPLLDESPEAKERPYAAFAAELPRGESLENTVARVLPYYESDIQPQLREGKDVLIVAHGNSLRALVKVLENIADDVIPTFEFPTGVPYVLRLNENLGLIDSGFRGDPKQIESAIQAVRNQGKAR